MSPSSDYLLKFTAYFDRAASKAAAKSLANGAEIEFRVAADHDSAPTDTFTFTKIDGQNRVVAGAARNCQLIFTLTPEAADKILGDTSEDVGEIGVHIMKLIVSTDPKCRVWLKIDAGFFALFTKGYFGVMTAGGGAFASFLASRG